MWSNLIDLDGVEVIYNLSYGKDSMAGLHVAIDLLGLPVHRIVHAEVWATDTIPADLPPMVEFKAKADAYIKQRWGLTVEHIYATRGGRSGASAAPSTNDMSEVGTSESFVGSRCSGDPGARTGSNGASLTREKLTYEKLFYHIPERKDPDRGGAQDGHISRGHGATPNSRSGPIWGFPTRWSLWCNSDLKRAAIRLSHQQSQRRELVQTTQDRPFRKAPGGEGRRKISCIYWASRLMSRSASPGI